MGVVLNLHRIWRQHILGTILSKLVYIYICWFVIDHIHIWVIYSDINLASVTSLLLNFICLKRVLILTHTILYYILVALFALKVDLDRLCQLIYSILLYFIPTNQSHHVKQTNSLEKQDEGRRHSMLFARILD